jgi:DNA-binding transcriptional regulator YiaG
MSISEITGREPLTPLPAPAERVRLREAFGISQTQLAEALNVNRRTVYMWESGRGEPTGPNRDAYAAVLSAWADTLKQQTGELAR